MPRQRPLTARDAAMRSNSTTRPPWSPVARKSPEWSNSTAEMMSAAGRQGGQREQRQQRNTSGGGNRRGTLAAAAGGRRGGAGPDRGLGARPAAWRPPGAPRSPSCTSSPGDRSPNTWLKCHCSGGASSSPWSMARGPAARPPARAVIHASRAVRAGCGFDCHPGAGGRGSGPRGGQLAGRCAHPPGLNCRCLCCQLLLWGRGWRGAGLIAEAGGKQAGQAGGRHLHLSCHHAPPPWWRRCGAAPRQSRRHSCKSQLRAWVQGERWSGQPPRSGCCARPRGHTPPAPLAPLLAASPANTGLARNQHTLGSLVSFD